MIYDLKCRIPVIKPLYLIIRLFQTSDMGSLLALVLIFSTFSSLALALGGPVKVKVKINVSVGVEIIIEINLRLMLRI